MQTPAEKYLVKKLILTLKINAGTSITKRILNAGAGKNVVIEKKLLKANCEYVCDRIDIANCYAKLSTIAKCLEGSIEDMKQLTADSYSVVFCNYVLEHVENLSCVAKEIYRVLVKNGIFILTIPNPLAPEFFLSRHTPYWFHKIVVKGNPFEKKYSYNNIEQLCNLFFLNGFELEDEKYWSFLEGYLYKYPFINKLGKLYDKIVMSLKYKRLMGNVCLIFKKIII